MTDEVVINAEYNALVDESLRNNKEIHCQVCGSKVLKQNTCSLVDNTVMKCINFYAVKIITVQKVARGLKIKA